MKRRFLRIALAMAVLLISGQVFAQESVQHLEHGDYQRNYYLHVPETLNPDEPAPLLIALHSTGASARAMMTLTGLNDAADEQGFIVVYPQALDISWNMDDEPIANLLDDDVDFLAQLVETLKAEHNIGSVHLVGEGGGGLLAYRVACEQPAAYESIMIVGALLWESMIERCGENPGGATNMLIIHGTQDQAYPVDGIDRGEDRSNSVAETVQFWSERFGCDFEAFEVPQETVNIRFNPNCAEDKTLAYYGVIYGNNTWFRIREDHALNQLGVDATDLVSNFMVGDPAWRVAQAEPTEDTSRSYRVYMPDSYDPSQPTPMVFVLHGRPGSGAGMAFITDMSKVAEEHGFIAVYPDGIQQQWYYVRDIPLYVGPGRNYSDFEFFRELVADLSLDFNVDSQRVYVTGFSNGGFMTNRLACEMPDVFAAFAPVGSGVFSGMDDPNICAEHGHVPILLMHGTRDISIPWDGIAQPLNNGEVGYTSTPVEMTLGFWAYHNECAGDVTDETLPQNGDSPETSVQIFTVQDCPEGAEVVLYAILGGGHNWPGVPDRISEQIAGDVNLDIEASEVIWEFFSQYTLDGGAAE